MPHEAYCVAYRDKRWSVLHQGRDLRAAGVARDADVTLELMIARGADAHVLAAIRSAAKERLGFPNEEILIADGVETLDDDIVAELGQQVFRFLGLK